MPLADWLGIFGGLLTTGSLIPQIMRVLKLRSAQEISLIYTTTQLTGIMIWLIYGIILSLTPVIVWNVIAVILIVALLFAKLRFGRKKSRNNT